MKSFVLFAFTLACALAFLDETCAEPSDTTTAPSKQIKEPKEIKESATATKEVKDSVKAAKEAKKNKKDCMKECGTVHDPICAHDPNDATFKPRTFGTQCALDVHNCEMGTKLVMKQKGECPGSHGVRLS
ncbi:uncharacterized protein LOC117603881 [Osmia lignaria lignaria]|uniref:uncharacterized protein LOC117603881 n=1 Tax=Osmia lignaria lignaria TaxID=1437193 RepID=UPI0014783B16|nr:uncharacterized protein LOC117603881 [Osmia lignaria]